MYNTLSLNNGLLLLNTTVSIVDAVINAERRTQPSPVTSVAMDVIR